MDRPPRSLMLRVGGVSGRTRISCVADFLAGADDGSHYSCVTRTAANLAAELGTNRVRIRISDPDQNIARHHEHARRAESALQGVALVEMTAQDLHDWIALGALKGLHDATVTHHGELQARARRFSLYRNGAGATSRRPGTWMSAMNIARPYRCQASSLRSKLAPIQPSGAR